MRGPFERRCAKATESVMCFALVEGSISESGHESLWCANGHSVGQWYVVDSEGNVMALAKLNSAPEILNDEMLLALIADPMYHAIIRKPPPNHTCKRGHSNWEAIPEGGYRCGKCRDASYESHKIRAREKYRSTPAYKSNQLAKKARKKEKKNVRD
jgi:hypothetical protein